jgi:hypothetical protein
LRCFETRVTSWGEAPAACTEPGRPERVTLSPGRRGAVPGVGKTREEAPLLPLCATENTRPRPVLLTDKQFLSAAGCLEEAPPS